VTFVYGQFAVDMGDQNAQSRSDTTIQAKEPFKLKTYFTALAGKDSLKLSRVFSGAVILPGYSQAYNRQYWKIPVVYAGMGAGIYMGYRYNMKYLDTENDTYALYRNLCYAGAGLFYWSSLLDGVVKLNTTKKCYPPGLLCIRCCCPVLDKSTTGTIGKFPSSTEALLPVATSGNTTGCNTNVTRPCIITQRPLLPGTKDG